MESSIFASICLLFLRFWLIETGFDWLHCSYVAQVGLLTLDSPSASTWWVLGLPAATFKSGSIYVYSFTLRDMESLSPGQHHTYSVADDDLKLLCVFPFKISMDFPAEMLQDLLDILLLFSKWRVIPKALCLENKMNKRKSGNYLSNINYGSIVFKILLVSQLLHPPCTCASIRPAWPQGSLYRCYSRYPYRRNRVDTQPRKGFSALQERLLPQVIQPP